MELEYKIFERDIDMLLMRMFAEKHAACKVFYKKLNINPAGVKVEKVSQSSYDRFGESDLQVDLSVDGKRHILLLEDKINAPAQENQCGRYEQRAEEILKTNKADVVSIILVAPQEYINSPQAEKYKIGKHIIVSYEELRRKTRPGEIAYDMLSKACLKKTDSKVVDEKVTEYWQKYCEYCKEYNARTGANLQLIITVNTRSATSLWWAYHTALDNVTIKHKTDRGQIDMEFAGQKENLPSLSQKLKQFVDKANDGNNRKLEWVETGKSASLRIFGLKILPVTEPFDACAHEIENAMNQIRRLSDLAEELNNNGFSL